MEKFTKWRDEETGIHPFFHPKEKVEKNIVIKLSQLLLGVIKFPFIIVVFLLYYILAKCISLLPLPRILKRPIERLNDIWGSRLLLLLLGYYWIPSSYFRMSRKAAPTISPGSDIDHGHLIIANKQSYVDLLYFAFRFGARFASVPYDSEGEVVEVSVFGAIFESIFNTVVFTQKSKLNNTTTLNELLLRAHKYRLGPVVVFPEGTSSNGRAILHCTQVLKNLNVALSSIHIVAIKYDWESFCPSYTLGSFFYHLLYMAGQIYNSMQVRYLSPFDIQEGSGDYLQLLANTMRLKMIQIKPLQKRDFLDFYKKGTQKSYIGKN